MVLSVRPGVISDLLQRREECESYTSAYGRIVGIVRTRLLYWLVGLAPFSDDAHKLD